MTVIVPGPAHLSLWQGLRHGRTWSGLMEPLSGMGNVSVVVVREHGGPGHRSQPGHVWVSPRRHHVAVILAGRLDRTVIKAIRYARQIEASDIRVLHAAVDPFLAERLAEQWGEVGHVLQVPLDVVECADRNIARAVTEYIHQLQGRESEVTVVIPRREYPGKAERLLHDRTSRAIARALVPEPHVDVVAVPYRVRRRITPPTEQSTPRPIAQAGV